jgi:hypothetical protein
LLFTLVVLALVVTVLAGAPVYAQSAKDASWVVSVTYQNVGSGSATINVAFYEEGSATAIDFNPLEGVGDGKLAAGAGASFYIGKVSGLDEGWHGGAVMSSDEPLVATVVQFSQDSGFKMRLLSNGFQSSDASEQYLIATALLGKFSRTTVFSVQNVESQAIRATVKLYDADASGALAATKDHVIPANSTKYIDVSNTSDTGLPAGTTVFNGSAIITAVLDSTPTTSAKVVAAASEYYTNRPVAANFEGVPLSQASTTVYMGTGLCEKFGLDTFYAVQNASLTGTAFIEVTYRDTNGVDKATDGRYEIGPGQKKSIRTCNPSDGTGMTGFTGSAVIKSYAAATGSTPGAPLVTIGKAQNSIAAGGPGTADVFTAFLGQGSGTSKLALPFIRWAHNDDYNAAGNTGGSQRAYVAVQNLESSTIKVNVVYRDKDGNEEGRETLVIAGYAKGNSNANLAGALGTDGQFGYYGRPVTSYGGAVVVEAHPDNPTAEFLAVVRVQHPGAGEDYNGVPIE